MVFNRIDEEETGPQCRTAFEEFQNALQCVIESFFEFPQVTQTFKPSFHFSCKSKHRKIPHCVFARGVLPYKCLMGTCSKPGYVFRDFCLKQGIKLIIFCLNQGIDLSIFVLNKISLLGRLTAKFLQALVNQY